MNITHLTRSLTRSAGGLFYAVAGLAAASARAGHAVTAIGGADDHFAEDRAEWGPAVQLVPYSAGTVHGFDAGVLAQIRNRDFELLHVQGIWTANSIYGLAGSKNARGTVVSPHGMLDPWILSRSPLKKAVHSRLFEKPLLRRAVIHALCQSEADSCAAYMPGAEDRIFVVPNGIDLPAGDTGRPEDKSGTLYLSRVHEKKQTIELVEAWARSPATRDERLTIAGWGDSEYEAALRKAVADKPMVEFVGSAYGEAKTRLLSRSRYFILPSLSEGLPMAVLEAISYGAIPIITKSCNLPELIADGTAIELREDLQDLSDIFAREAVREPSELVAHSERCRRRALDYTWDEIGRRMEPLYEKALAMGHKD